MKQEGGHIDFYASEAGRRLAESPKAQRLTHFALKHFWRPVGSGVMPKEEVGFLVRYLFDGDARQRHGRTHRPSRRPPARPGQLEFAQERRLEVVASSFRCLIARFSTSDAARPPNSG